MNNDQKQRDFATIVARFNNRNNSALARIGAAVDAAAYLDGNGPIRDETQENELPDYWLSQAYCMIGLKIGKDQ